MNMKPMEENKLMMKKTPFNLLPGYLLAMLQITLCSFNVKLCLSDFMVDFC